MDPKPTTSSTPGTLDPKLKEMYDRIMAINVRPTGQTSSVPSASLPPQSVAVQPAPAQVIPSAPSSATNQTGQPAIPQTPIMPPNSASVSPVSVSQIGPAPIQVIQPQTVQTVAQTLQKQSTSFAAQAKKKGGLSPMTLLLAVGGVIFLGVYTVFWIKFFNLPVSFLPF